jgi:HEAT repeat protein
LRDTIQRLKRILDESVHDARLLDLGLADKPDAVNAPWGYESAAPRAFESLQEAFDMYDRRLLILGEPGAGKSIALRRLALAMAIDAERDPEAPIPLVVNLSTFRFESSTPSRVSKLARAEHSGDDVSAQKSDAFEEWLASEFAERPGMPRTIARRWVSEGRVAAFLDGLDEVNDERRADLAVLLNDTYIKDKADSVVVICSRAAEYLPLQQLKTARLQLPGAIVIQAPSAEQIDDYLTAAGATGLRNALGRDKALYELAKTPLTLSIMTLAYEGRSADTILTSQRLADQRHQLMETFVARMLQRLERRQRAAESGSEPETDISPDSYRYRPEQVNRYLSWLAIRLSVRMQTACGLRRFHSFLAREAIGQEDWVASWLVLVARGALMVGVLVFALAMTAPKTRAGLTVAAILLGGACAIYVILTQVRRLWPSDPEPIAGIGGAIVVAGASGLASHSLARTLPFQVAALDVGLIATAALITLIVLCLAIAEGDTEVAVPVVGMTALGAIIGIVCVKNGWFIGSAGRTIACSVVVGQVTGFCVFAYREVRGRRRIAMLCLAIVATAAGIVFTEIVVGFLPTNWVVMMAVLSCALALCLVVAQRPAWPTALLGLAAITGHVAYGYDGSVLATTALGVVWLLIVLALSSTGEMRVLERVVERAEDSMDQWLLTPATLAAAAVARGLPWRPRDLLRYGGRAMILKPFSGDVEFIHRRVRDHFALRELIPRLQDSDPRRRPEVIRALGFQGVAALDTLGELALEGTVSEKVAAVSALSRISAPEVMPFFERALEDTDAEVREAVVRGLRHTERTARVSVLKRMASDPGLGVRQAVLDAAAALQWPDSRLFDELFRAMLDDGRDVLEILRHTAMISTGRHESIGPDGFFVPLPSGLTDAAQIALGQLLVDNHPRIRAAACDWSAANDRRENCVAIIHLLRRDSDAAVRTSAAYALGRLGNRGNTEPLVDALWDKNEAVRATAAGALGALSHPLGEKEANRLLVLLQDRSADVRREVAGALVLLRNQRSLVGLIRLLRDRDQDVRVAAVMALGAIGGPEVERPLLRCLDDPDVRVCQQAAHTLARLGSGGDEFRRMVSHRSKVKRELAVLYFAQARDSVDGKLLSVDVDGLGPWLDPKDPVSQERVLQCSTKLGLSVDEVRNRYEALSRDLGLMVDWM